MGTVSRVHTFSAGSVLTAAQLNNEFDNLLTSSAINGGLDATNLGVTAGQVTASKGLVVDGSRNLDDTTSSNMINNLTLSGTLKLIDDQTLTLGTNDDITVKYDETTNDALEIAAAVNGQPLAIVLKADRGDDAADEWKLNIADGGVLTLGNDIASAGTYVTGMTITPNSTTASWLLDFEGDVDVGGDTLSFNGAATIDTSGNNNLSLSAGTADVVVTASNLAPASNDGSAIGVSGTAWSDLFLASGAVVNFNAGDVTLTHSSNTLTVAGGTLATAALTASTITASGIIKTDDTTEATSTADGSLQTDGGLSVVKDAVFGDDVKLLSDSAVLALGDGSDATLTHDGTTGVTIAANPITVDSGAALTLDAHTGVFVFKDAGSEVLRFTEGNSGDVTVKLATNGKDLVFTDNGDATNMKILDAAAGINVPGEVQTTKIAYTDGDDAITIADGGGATFSQTVTVGANGGGKDVQLYGATSGSNILLDASADDLILTNFGLAVGSDATGDVYYRDANGFLARLGVGSNGQVLTTNGTIPSWGAASDSGISFDGSTANGMLTYKDSDEATVESTLTFASDIMTATSTSSNLPIIRLKNTHNGATSGIIKFENDKGAAGADNDVCGTITFIGDDDNQDQTEFARIEGVVADASHGDECGALKLYVAENDGTNTVGLSLTGSTTDGEVDATIGAGTASVVTVPGHIDLAGDIDVDGTLEADAITIGGTAIGSIYGVVAGSSSIVTTGALDSGSITSGFGNIDTGSSTITTTGSLQVRTIDYSDGDNAITIADGGGMTFPQDLTLSGTLALANDEPVQWGTSDTSNMRGSHGASGYFKFRPGGNYGLFLTAPGEAVFNEETANANCTQGITIQQGANDNEIFALKSSDVNQPCTDRAEADTFFNIVKEQPTSGGARLEAFKDADGVAGACMIVKGVLGEAVDANKNTSARSVVEIQAFVTNGSTGQAAPATNGNCLTVWGGATPRFIWDVEGSAFADVEWTTFDKHDDVAMLHDIEASLVPDTFGKAMKYDAPYLEKVGIIGEGSIREENGKTRGFINTNKLQMLHHGAIRQVHQQLQDVKDFYEDKIAALEQRLLRLEA